MADRLVGIAASGSDYTTYALAIAGEADFQAGEDNIVFQRLDNVRETGQVDVTGFTTSSSHRVILECTRDVQHDGTRGSGAGIVGTTDWTGQLLIGISYVTIRYLTLGNNSSNSSYACLFTSASNIIFDSCLIYGAVNGLYLYTSPNYMINCIVYGGSGFAVRMSTDGCYLYYNTVLNGSICYESESWGTQTVKNCYGGGASGDDYATPGTFAKTTCASSDGTESTTTIALADCAFTSYTAGSEDANIGSGSDLIGAGTSLSSDDVYPVTVDCFGTTRASTPCIGAIEYVSTGSSHVVGIMQAMNQFNGGLH
jgi:hypothetical protein